MTKIDIVSGFLGAGKTTLIKKLLKEGLADTKVVLIENEFGEIGIDGGFLKDAGIEIKEMNSGCICCSLVGDFGASLKEVLTTYSPERVIIEPSGVGKLSDVVKAVEGVASEVEVEISSAVAVVDGTKCKMYIKNFGEFFCNQIEHAGTIILSRTGKMTQEKLETAIALIREHNAEATIITTPWEDLDGKDILQTIEGANKLEDMMKEMLEHAEHEHHHHEHGEDCTCGCHDHDHEHHHHHDHDHDHECCHHDHGHEHEHDHHEHHHHEHGEDCTCGCHDHDHEHHHHHDHDHDHDHDHEHHHHHDHDHDHEHEHHHHEHGEDCTCGCHDHDHEHHHDHHGHHHHHADEIFTSWGKETPATYSKEEIQEILDKLGAEEEYGFVLRAKGMVPSADGTWVYFDYVPEECDIRSGKPEVTGKICVIGSKLKEDKLEQLFK
ncbi:MAG: GTP-binding protein [Lachnospiraceae bacterium]|nr:GTP-binding protein [Lachnospiraceae bacterium]